MIQLRSPVLFASFKICYFKCLIFLKLKCLCVFFSLKQHFVRLDCNKIKKEEKCIHLNEYLYFHIYNSTWWEKLNLYESLIKRRDRMRQTLGFLFVLKVQLKKNYQKHSINLTVYKPNIFMMRHFIKLELYVIVNILKPWIPY